MRLSLFDLAYELREQIYLDILPSDRRLRAEAAFWKPENHGSIRNILQCHYKVFQEFSYILYEKCTIDIMLSYEHISFLGLTEDSPTLYSFNYANLRHISICIDHFLVKEPATLYDLRARIIQMVDIFRKVPSKLRKLDIAFIDEPLSGGQSDPVWATEENYVRQTFECKSSRSAVQLLLEPFLALQNRFERVEITPIQGESDDMLAGWPVLLGCTEDTALVMEGRTEYPGRMDRYIYGMLSKKDPIKRINATSEWMWRLLPRLEQADNEQSRERRQKARAQPLYCLLDDPDWRRLHSHGRRLPATKDMIEEAFRYPSGKESSEQLVFDVPYSVLATWSPYYTICPHNDLRPPISGHKIKQSNDTMTPHQHFLFGGNSPWTATDWTASDDRVRGGSSQVPPPSHPTSTPSSTELTPHSTQSHLTITPPSSTNATTTARFHGTLDITTLGGAGFASQRTATSSRVWDLSAYDGIMLDVGRGDGKVYTFIVKDEILPPEEGGREQSTVSWEYDFRVEGGGEGGGGVVGDGKGEEVAERAERGKRVWIPWGKFKATYRGKEKRDAAPIDLGNVRRLSLMMRSFFGTQEGEFSLVVKSISALKETDERESGPSLSKEAGYDGGSGTDEKGAVNSGRKNDDDQQSAGLLSWLSTMCIVS